MNRGFLRTNARAFSFFVVIWTLTVTPLIAANVNSWTKPNSGNWEEPYWSLGRLPMSGDSVFINNPGWKAVAIGASTLRDFPASMEMQDLTIASPVDSFNTLLVNFTGFERPVKVTGRFTVESSAAAIVLGSLLHVTNTGDFIVNGTVRQADFSQVRTLALHLGSEAFDSAYYFSNGLFAANVVLVDSRSLFNQDGGSGSVSNLSLINQGQFRLVGGELVGGQVSVGNGSAGTFAHLGGSGQLGLDCTQLRCRCLYPGRGNAHGAGNVGGQAKLSWRKRTCGIHA